MRPLSVVTLIILGSSFAITFSLAAVVLVVLILGDDYPRLQREFDPLVHSLGLFLLPIAGEMRRVFSLYLAA